MSFRLDRACPNCGKTELFDATTTTDSPELYSKYPAFRGSQIRRVYCCFVCKAAVSFDREEDGSLTFVKVVVGERNVSQAAVDAY